MPNLDQRLFFIMFRLLFSIHLVLHTYFATYPNSTSFFLSVFVLVTFLFVHMTILFLNAFDKYYLTLTEV